MPRKTRKASLRTFDDIRSNPARALQIWQILIGAAHARKTLTYKELAGLLGYKGAGVLGRPLGRVAAWCEQAGLPPLTLLVVSQGEGIPGDGLPPRQAHDRREAVFREDWYALYPPNEAQLEGAFAAWRSGALTFI